MFELDTGMIFWTSVSFIIMLIILYKVVFPPLHKILDQRKNMIEGGLQKAKEAQAEAESLLQKYRGQLAETEKKTIEMFNDAQRKSEAIRDEGMKEAQKEAFKIIESSKKDIEVYKRRALTDLKEEITELIIDVAGRLVQKKLDRNEHLRLIDSSINELEKNAKRKI